jgi:hypothetical protein
LRPEANPHPGLVKYFDEILGCDLTSKNEQLREIKNRELKEWYMDEIDDLLEDLEVIEED